MTLIWKAGYSTGVSKLDEQHKRVFQMLNALEDMIHQGLYDSPEVDAYLARLGSHVTRHFSEEEGCMDRAHCPMALKNKQEHEKFLTRFVEFTSAFNRNKSLALLSQFHAEAESWIHEHVAFLDIHLRACAGAIPG